MMSARTAVDPDAIRLRWEPLEMPIECGGSMLNGEFVPFRITGYLRIEWDSPLGPFTILHPQRVDLGNDYEDLRDVFAMSVENAYNDRTAQEKHHA